MIYINKKYYYNSGQPYIEQHTVDKKYHHRVDGPAYIWYYESGQIQEARYFIDGLRHRLDGPAHIWYDEQGKIKSEVYIVSGICLENFNDVFSDDSLVENLFNYIQQYPQFKNEVIILARHNKWLNEYQLLLLEINKAFN